MKRLPYISIITAILVIISRPYSYPQSISDDAQDQADSIKTDDHPQEQAVIRGRETFVERKTGGFTPNPTGALLRSLAFPGWGQLYNRKYVKAAAVAAGESFFLYFLLRNRRDSGNYKDKFESLIPRDRPGGNYPAGAELNGLSPTYWDSRQSDAFNNWRHYDDEMNKYIWFTAAFIFLSMFDAYVDAHLWAFDEEMNEDLKVSGVKISFEFQPPVF